MEKLNKKILLIIVSLLFALLLSGCGGQDQQSKEQEPKEETAISDLIGKELTLEEAPNRIVTFVPSLTETVFALGIGDKLVGRTDWCNYPEEVVNIPSIGGMEFDVEKILSLKPDLLITHEMGISTGEAGYEQLKDAGIPILIVPNESTIEDVYRNIELIGKATHATEAAEELISSMKTTFTEYAEKAQAISEEEKRRVWVEIDPTLITVGKNTFLTEMLELINAENIAGDQEGWPQFSEEEVIGQNPDVILITYGYYVENAKDEVLKRNGWQDVNAIKNGQVYDIDNDMVTRAGPRLVKGVEELANVIYPEIFGQ